MMLAVGVDGMDEEEYLKNRYYAFFTFFILTIGLISVFGYVFYDLNFNLQPMYYDLYVLIPFLVFFLIWILFYRKLLGKIYGKIKEKPKKTKKDREMIVNYKISKNVLIIIILIIIWRITRVLHINYKFQLFDFLYLVILICLVGFSVISCFFMISLCREYSVSPWSLK
jgi:uncharacterized protein (DUF983 family)